MEWQAAYWSGALLMPRGAVQQLIMAFSNTEGRLSFPLSKDSLEAISLISALERGFGVSRPAAATRLRQLGYLVGQAS